jgi:hypothetical protein
MLKTCKECGGSVSSKAKSCPHCGAPQHSNLWIYVSVVSSIFVVILILIMSLVRSENASPPIHNTGYKTVQIGAPSQPSSSRSNSTQRQGNAQLTQRLNYLNGIPEIKWVKFDNNNVYIGFNPIPSDVATITAAAAFQGNKALGFGVHVWAVDAGKYDRSWQPGTGSYLLEKTARYGKVQN